MNGYWLVGGRIVAVTLAATIAGCDAVRQSGDITGKSIRYEVEYYGSPEDALSHSALTIRYTTNEGQQEQKDVGLPWTKAVGSAKPGFKASVTAQFSGFGTIACRIVANGKVVKQQTSAEDPYAVVECSA
jgi:hypothetical protein